jgi:hypothetical protein
MIGLMQFLVNVFAEGCNILYLQTFDTVQNCIIHFINMSVIMDVSAIYYRSLGANELKQLFKTKVESCRGRDIKWSDRRCFHKFARIIYKVMRAFYVSFIFYLVPFTTILFAFFMGYPFAKKHEGRPEDWAGTE